MFDLSNFEVLASVVDQAGRSAILGVSRCSKFPLMIQSQLL